MGQIIPLSGFEADIQDLNARLATLAATMNSSQSPIALANHYGAVSLNDTFDRVHPNDSGDRKMADVWYDALTPLLS